MSGWRRDLILAGATTLGAFLLRLALDRVLGREAPFLTFTVAVGASALYGGVRAGALAAVLGATVALAVFKLPRIGQSPDILAVVVHILLFAAVSAILVGLCHALRRARSAAEASEQSLMRILDTTESGILVLDADGYITFANPAAARLFGLTPGHMIGRPHDDPGWGITRPDGTPIPPHEMPAARALRDRRRVFGSRLLLRGVDDSPIPVTVNAAPLPDHDAHAGGVVLSLADVRDLSERDR